MYYNVLYWILLQRVHSKAFANKIFTFCISGRYKFAGIIKNVSANQL